MEEMIMIMKRFYRELERFVIPVLIFIPGMIVSNILDRIWYNCGPCQYASYASLAAGITFFSVGIAFLVDQVYWSRKKRGRRRVPFSLHGIGSGVLATIIGSVYIVGSIAELLAGCQAPRC
jgi:hypothetical protein